MTSRQLHIENALLIRIAEGEEDAFASLFRTALPHLEPFLRKILGSEEGLMEVVQETFIRIWISRDKLPTLDKPVHWIFKVASNECFTWLNKQALRTKIIGRLEKLPQDVQNEGPSYLAVKETKALINEAIAKLSPRRRTIYLLSRQEGLNTAEIAERLSISQRAVKNTLSTALHFIRNYLISAGKVLPVLYLLYKK